MFYPKNKEKELSRGLFKNPTAEYRGTPFWAWNCKLSKDELTRQIEVLKQMGFGGFHMHSRSGMATKYLSDEFMELVKTCVDKAENEGMRAYLYDEDRWPSGSAGDIVTKEPKYRAKYLRVTKDKLDGDLLACYDIILNSKGELSGYKLIDENEKVAGFKRYAYLCTRKAGDPWFNNQTYVDTLSKEAINKFIETTHEAYKKAVGESFGKTVPSIFTDEPQFDRKKTLDFAQSDTDVTLPWTTDFVQTFKSTYGTDILEKLPELFWELENGEISKARYCYHDHITQRFTEAFADNVGGWCDKNGIALTGHMMEEPTLFSQTSALGEAMRAYRAFAIPGIDMLCAWTEFTTAKQAQSAVHQYGREAMMSELYGVTDWDFDFRGHKFHGDWQAALGVTLRVPHLSWVSMAGEAKRDYPASINYQVPWYKEYTYIENYFARVNTALTRGKAKVKVAVIHPIESYWLHFGPKENTASIREQLDNNFKNTVDWLLNGLIDFDFICESLLPEQAGDVTDKLNVGEMSYDAVLIPGCETLRSTTVDILNKFRKNGGEVVFAGECPKYADAEKSDTVLPLYNSSKCVTLTKTGILDALEDYRDIDIRNADGSRTDNLIYNYRADNGCSWLFIAHSKQAPCKDVSYPQKITLKIKGVFKPTVYNALNGETEEISYYIKNGMTVIDTVLYSLDSLLLKLTESDSGCNTAEAKKFGGEKTVLNKIVNYKRSEPNVLLLDYAKYALDDEPQNAADDILRLDNKCREKLGYQFRAEAFPQPWCIDEEPITHSVTLEFEFYSDMEYSGAQLAIEDAELHKLFLNNEAVRSDVTGWYVDKSIKTVALPKIKIGKNVLRVILPFGKHTNTEYCYILGDFNVKVEGQKATITEKTDKIGFGSITSQGMPFYGGNVEYETEFFLEKNGDISVTVSRYRGALVKASVDGGDEKTIVFDPYTADFENLKKGTHTLKLTLFGNRFNTFGALHNADYSEVWIGPDYWRSTGDKWSFEYIFKDTGILSAPVITMK